MGKKINFQIEKIDKNFAAQTVKNAEERTTYAIPHPDFTLHGLHYNEQEGFFFRMHQEVADRVSEGVRSLAKYTAGGRLRFATDSSYFRIDVEYDALGLMPHMPLTGSSGFSLFEEVDGKEWFVRQFAPTDRDKCGYFAETELSGGVMRQYILYFPLYNEVRALTVTLSGGATLGKANAYRDEKPILYYGSSITQGGCASRPDNAYQALIAKKNHIDFINLGFSGSARAESVMVDYLASIDCSLFVCDYDHNAANADYLEKTHYALYEQYRKARPDVPILFLTKPDYTRDPEGERRIKIVRSTYLRAKRKGDENVYFLSGKRFYGNGDCWEFAVDGCHPTDYGFAMMAKEIYRVMLQIDKKFGTEAKK